MIEIYVGATQNLTINMGGWGVVVIDEEGGQTKDRGCEAGANQMRMILKAAIEGLSKTEQGCEAKILSNNQYLVLGINDSRQRQKNRDLWGELEELMSRRHIEARQIGSNDRWLKEAQILAKEAVGSL